MRFDVGRVAELRSCADKITPKHLDRHGNEFGGRYNIGKIDTGDQLTMVALRMDGKRSRHCDLIASNGLDWEARSR